MTSSEHIAPDDVIDRMSRSWRELRRGPAAAFVRDQLFGIGTDALEPTQIDVLDLLVQRPDWRMNELAAALRVDPSTVTRTLQRMELAGLAGRSPDRHDGRAITVHITTIGRDCQGMVAARRRAIIGQILTEFDDEDRQRLVVLLERFIAGANEYAGVMSDASLADERVADRPGADELRSMTPGPAATAAG